VTDRPTPERKTRTRRLPPRVQPNTGLPDWPATPSDDPAIEKVRQLAARLAAVMDERGLAAREVARLAGISVNTVQVIRFGKGWPDSHAIARLEVVLDTALWPAHGDHA